MGWESVPRGTAILAVYGKCRNSRCSPKLCDSRLLTSLPIFFLVPVYGRHFEPGQLQFITTSTNRRPKLFDSLRFLLGVCRSVARRAPVLGCKSSRSAPPTGSSPRSSKTVPALGAGTCLRAYACPPRFVATPVTASGSAVCSLQRVLGEEADRETRLYAPQSSQEKAGEFARSMAVVKLQVLSG